MEKALLYLFQEDNLDWIVKKSKKCREMQITLGIIGSNDFEIIETQATSGAHGLGPLWKMLLGILVQKGTLFPNEIFPKHPQIADENSPTTKSPKNPDIQTTNIHGPLQATKPGTY